MVKFIFILSFLLNPAFADFFSSGSKFKSKLPKVTEKLKSIEVKTDPSFEEKLTQLITEAESIFIEEREYCSGELADSQGNVVIKDQKEICFRELKNNYLETVDIVFNLKKKFLSSIHNQQLERLNKIQNKIKSDLENNF